MIQAYPWRTLKKIGITVFRKIVRRIMKEEHLTVPTKRMKNTQLI